MKKIVIKLVVVTAMAFVGSVELVHALGVSRRFDRTTQKNLKRHKIRVEYERKRAAAASPAAPPSAEVKREDPCIMCRELCTEKNPNVVLPCRVEGKEYRHPACRKCMAPAIIAGVLSREKKIDYMQCQLCGKPYSKETLAYMGKHITIPLASAYKAFRYRTLNQAEELHIAEGVVGEDQQIVPMEIHLRRLPARQCPCHTVIHHMGLGVGLGMLGIIKFVAQYPLALIAIPYLRTYSGQEGCWGDVGKILLLHELIMKSFAMLGFAPDGADVG